MNVSIVDELPKSFNYLIFKIFWRTCLPLLQLISRKRAAQPLYFNISLESPLHKHFISIKKELTSVSASKAILDANAPELPKNFNFLS